MAHRSYHEEAGPGGQHQVSTDCARNSGRVTFWSQFAAVVTMFCRTLPEARMKVLFGLAIGVLATQLGAQTASEEAAIHSIVQDEIFAWN